MRSQRLKMRADITIQKCARGLRDFQNGDHLHRAVWTKNLSVKQVHVKDEARKSYLFQWSHELRYQKFLEQFLESGVAPPREIRPNQATQRLKIRPGIHPCKPNLWCHGCCLLISSTERCLLDVPTSRILLSLFNRFKAVKCKLSQMWQRS